MTAESEKKGVPPLRIEQVATLCGVSVARVDSWIEKNGLKFMGIRGERKVRQEDLVGFLIHYNMPIPAGILPMNAKKILFIYPERRGKKAGQAYLKLLAKHFCQKANCYLDGVTFGKIAEYKILTFLPDLILADAVNGEQEALSLIRFIKSIGGMRAVALVHHNLAQAKRERFLAAGAHVVMDRNSGWEELLGCISRVFNSLGKHP